MCGEFHLTSCPESTELSKIQCDLIDFVGGDIVAYTCLANLLHPLNDR